MHQLRYPDEVKPWSDVPAAKHVKASPAELGLARQVIEGLRHETFDPSRYKDEVKARVRGLIARKAKGGEITAPPSTPRAPVTDLMAALKASLGAGGTGQPATRNGARKPAAKHATAARPRRSTAGHTRSARPQKARAHSARASRASGATSSAARPAHR
jgi:DNA end-binding protein Ku